jgi:PilZ domain-containing protein
MPEEPASLLRRHNPRFETPEGVWVFWSCDGRDEISQVRDLSLGGLFVYTANPRAVGATTTLDFLFQEGQIRADGVVRYVNPGHGVGLKFSAMRDGDRPHLAALLNRLSRSS